MTLSDQVSEPAVPMHGCMSATSIQKTGPALMWSIFPVSINC